MTASTLPEKKTKTETTPTPRVVVYIEGGIVQWTAGDTPVEVVVIDSDTDTWKKPYAVWSEDTSCKLADMDSTLVDLLRRFDNDGGEICLTLEQWTLIHAELETSDEDEAELSYKLKRQQQMIDGMATIKLDFDEYQRVKSIAHQLGIVVPA